MKAPKTDVPREVRDSLRRVIRAYLPEAEKEELWYRPHRRPMAGHLRRVRDYFFRAGGPQRDSG